MGVNIPQKQRNTVFALLLFSNLFGTLPSTALYPSFVYVFKGGEVCLNTVISCQEFTFPRVGALFLGGNLIS